MKARKGLVALVAIFTLVEVALGALNTKKGGSGDDLSELSFSAPFTDFSLGTGDRLIGANWRTGGSTTVKENFVRLTPDRPNQQGWAQSNIPLAKDEFSILLKFRVSGQGKTLYGDGMALWITEAQNRRGVESGPLLGHGDTFRGIGILFDTFRNDDKGHIHKSLSLVQSSGTTVTLDKQRPGCQVKFRYHEGRDSFSITDYSAAKITLVKNVLSVQFDKKGSDQWFTCFTQDLSKTKDATPLEEGFLTKAKHYVYFSAATGDVSDNHDILDFIVTEPDGMDDIIKAKIKDVEDDLEFAESSVSDELLRDQVKILSEEVKTLKLKISNLEHKLEHKMETVEHNLVKMIDGVGADEKSAEKRIKELEEKSKESLFKSLDERLRDLENRVTGTMDRRIKTMEKKLELKVETTTSNMGGGWKWPLFIVVLIVAVFMGWNVYSVRKLHSRDKLF